MSQDQSGAFDFTVSSADTNLAARAYLEPSVRRYVRSFDDEDALRASAFLEGVTYGLLGFIEPGDAIYLRSLGTHIPEAITDLWRVGHPDFPQDDHTSTEGPNIYRNSWYLLWREIYHEVNFYKVTGTAMPELVALQYLGQLHGRRFLGDLPLGRYVELENLLTSFARGYEDFHGRLVFDPEILRGMRLRD